MQGIQATSTPCSRPQDFGSGSARYDLSRLNALSVWEEQNTDLSIVTAEGDRVTISADYRAEATVATYEHLALSDAGFRIIEANMLDFKVEQDIAVSVEGELNETELADIKTLLSDLGSMLKEAVAAGGGEPHWAGDEFSELTSIASVQAEMEYHASLGYWKAETEELAVGGVTAPPLPEGPATPEPAAAKIAASPPAAAEPQAPLPAPSEAAAVAERMTQRVTESRLKPRRLHKLLRKFLREFWKDMTSKERIGADRTRLGEDTLEKFFDRLRSGFKTLENTPGQLSGEFEVKASKVAFAQISVESSMEYHMDTNPEPVVEQTV
jgi:hypothetical protein